MKKMAKNRLEKISSRIWIILFWILLILVIKTSIGGLSQVRHLEYGPYTCEQDIMRIEVEENKNRFEWVSWNKIHFIWNNKDIKTTEDYNFEGVKDFTELPWKLKCSPLIINEPNLAEKISHCVEKIMNNGTLESDRIAKNGLPFQICGIGYYNAGEKYE